MKISFICNSNCKKKHYFVIHCSLLLGKELIENKEWIDNNGVTAVIAKCKAIIHSSVFRLKLRNKISSNMDILTFGANNGHLIKAASMKFAVIYSVIFVNS